MGLAFKGELVSKGPKGAWTHMPIPLEVTHAFGSKARVAVKGAINGFPFRTSIMPTGNGSHYMNVSREMQKGAQAAPGDVADVVMEIDAEERAVSVPDDLQAALASAGDAGKIFSSLAYSHRKEFVVWIEQAKRPETRARRVEKSVAMIAAGERLDS